MGVKGEEIGFSALGDKFSALGGKFGFGGTWVFILFLILILLIVGIN